MYTNLNWFMAPNINVQKHREYREKQRQIILKLTKHSHDKIAGKVSSRNVDLALNFPLSSGFTRASDPLVTCN